MHIMRMFVQQTPCLWFFITCQLLESMLLKMNHRSGWHICIHRWNFCAYCQFSWPVIGQFSLNLAPDWSKLTNGSPPITEIATNMNRNRFDILRLLASFEWIAAVSSPVVNNIYWIIVQCSMLSLVKHKRYFWGDLILNWKNP